MNEQEKREKVIVELDQCLCDSVVAVVPADTVQDAIALLKRSFTPKEVYDTVIEHAQHDMRFKLGDKIDYSFTDVVDIRGVRAQKLELSLQRWRA